MAATTETAASLPLEGRAADTAADNAGAGGAGPVLEAAGDGAVVVPGGAWMLTADFARSGPDLVLTGQDGKTVVVRDYFSSDAAPDLQTEGGAVISGDLASRLAGPVAPEQFAQAAPTAALEPIGKVAATDGAVTITRATGAKVTAVKDTPVFQGDTVETGKGAAVGITFVDDSTFSLGDSGRMVIDEMVYDPGEKTGQFSANLVQGVFSFVSGQIAKTSPEGMIVKTPVATIGIRGTKVAGRAAQEGEENTIALLPEIDPLGNQIVGELTVSNAGGTVTLNQIGATVALSSAFQAPPPPVIVPLAQLEATFGAALNSLPPPPSQAAGQDAANGEGGNGEGGNGEGGNGEGQAAEGAPPPEGEGQPAEGEGGPPAEGEGQLAEGEGGPPPEGEGGPGIGDGGGDQLAAAVEGAGPGPVGDGGNPLGGPADGDAGAPLGGDAGASPFGPTTNPFGGGLFGDNGGSLFGDGGGLFGDTGGGLLGGADDGNLLDSGTPNLLDTGGGLLGDGGLFGPDPFAPIADGTQPLVLDPNAGDDPILNADPVVFGETFYAGQGDETFFGNTENSEYVFLQGTAFSATAAGSGGTDIIDDAGGLHDRLTFAGLDGTMVKVTYADATSLDFAIYTNSGTTATSGTLLETVNVSNSIDDLEGSADTIASPGSGTVVLQGAMDLASGETAYMSAGTDAGNDTINLSGDANAVGALIFGKGGADTLTGTVGDDVIYGGLGDDILDGGGDGGTGNILNGGDGNDTLKVTDDAATNDIIGGAGTDTASFSTLGSAVSANVYATSVTATTGGGGSAYITGTEIIVGSATAANAFSLSGDLTAGAVTSLIGGGGNDSFYLNSGATYAGTLDGGAGTDTVYLGSGATMSGTATGIEKLALYGTAANDSFSGFDFAATVGGVSVSAVVGGAGTDSVAMDSAITTLALTGIEQVTGTTLGDSITFTDLLSGATASMGAGTDTVTLANGTNSLSLYGTESVVMGGTTSQNVLSVSTAMSGTTFTGTANSNDTLSLANTAGNAVSVSAVDTVSGASGTDTVTMTSAGNLAVSGIEAVTGSAGTDTVTLANGGNTITITSVETVIGGTGADAITGDAAATNFTGGAGNDAITGGAGTDVASYSGNLAEFFIGTASYGGKLTLTDGNTGDGLDEGADTLSGVESLAFANATISVTTASGEQQVNTTTTATQSFPQIVGLADGGYVTFWMGLQSGTYDVYGQRYNALGVKEGAEFAVNPSTTGNQQLSDTMKAQSLSSGGFVVTWLDDTADASSWSAWARIYDSTGTAVTGGLQLNTTTANEQSHPSFTELSNGELIFVWHSNLQDGSSFGVYGQRYSADGTAQGSEFQVNTTTTNYQYQPVVTKLGTGFVVVWSDNSSGANDIVLQRYDSAGTKIGGETQVNTYTTGNQYYPSVTTLSSGKVVIGWYEENGNDGSGTGSYARIMNADGTFASAEIQVHTTTAGAQGGAVVEALKGGGFVAAWHSEHGVANYNVYAQVFDDAGTKVGGEFQVNTYTTDNQSSPEIASLTDGGFVISWHSNLQDGDAWGVYSQRFDASGNALSVQTLTGSTGNDTLKLAAGTEMVIDGDTGVDTVDLSAGGNNAISVANVEYITGGAGNDSIAVTATSANLTIDGGAGTDRIDLNAAGNGIYVTNVEAVWGASGNDIIQVTGSQGANLYGGAGADNLTGGAGADSIYGGAGEDVIYGSAGNDYIDMGAQTSNDWLYYSNLAGSITVTSTGTNTYTAVHSDGWTDTIVNTEAIQGTSGNDTFNISHAAAVQHLNGSTGTDTVTFASASGAFVGDLNANPFTIGGAAAGTLNAIENIVGTAYADTITGSTAANDITAGLGADVLYGGAGDDIFRLDESVAANDTVYGGLTTSDGATATGDAVYYQNTTDALTITLGNESGSVAGSATGTSIGTDTLYGIDKVFSGSGNDIIYGNAGFNQIDGGQGVDTIYGGMGIGDWLEGVGNGDTVAYDHTTGTQVGQEGVDVALTFTQTSSIQGTVSGTGMSATLNQFANVIGSQQNDTFVLNAASSVNFQGSGGIDTLNMSAQTGAVVANLSTGAVTVNAVGFGSVSQIENVIGGSAADTLTGDANANVITGGGAADTLTGGAGSDVFRYTATTDSAVAAGDSILDFDAGTGSTAIDSILFDLSSGFTFSFLGSEASAFTSTANLVEARFNDTSKLLEVDTNADGASDMEITMTGVVLANLDNTDFTVT